MTRPTRYCVRCGEYVDDRYVTRRRGSELTTTLQLVHIAGDGTRIDRNHQALEDLPYEILNSDGTVVATAATMTAASGISGSLTKSRMSLHTVRPARDPIGA